MKRMFAILLTLACTLPGPSHALPQITNDAEADAALLHYCNEAVARVTHQMRDPLLQLGGVETTETLAIGSCKLVDHRVYVTFPHLFKFTGMTFNGKPANLVFDASEVYTGKNIREPMIFQFYWTKKGVYDQFQNLVGYKYSFRYLGGRWAYTVWNGDTKRVIVQRAINEYRDFRD
ncbi:MAG TPA: hypothetical protein VFV50_19350 [Bdellovibrionales bacterium]|nr:hypothetical protein [Bdellovibrionales bacterium]